MSLEKLVAGIGGLLLLLLLALSACVQGTPQAESVVVTGSVQTTVIAQGDAALQVTSEEENRLATREAGLATEQAALSTDQAQATLERQATLQAGGAQQTTAAQQTIAAQATASQVAYEKTATADALEREASATVIVVIIEATAEEAAIRRTATAQAVERTATAVAGAAQQTATEQAYIRTATADAVNRWETATAAAAAAQATASEQAQIRTATVQAEDRDATRTAAALYAAQTATAEAISNRQQVVRYGVWGAVVVAVLGLFVILVLGLRSSSPSFSALWLRVRRRELEPPPEACPPVIVQPDGSVKVPMLTAAEREMCDYPDDHIIELLNWAREARMEAHARLTPVGPPSAPGLRSIHTLRRLDQAVKAGVISASLAKELEEDWEREVGT